MLELIFLVAWLVSLVISCATGAAVCGLIGMCIGLWAGWEKANRDNEATARLEEVKAEINAIAAAKSIAQPTARSD